MFLTTLLIVAAGVGVRYAVSRSRRSDRGDRPAASPGGWQQVGARRAGGVMLVVGLVATLGATFLAPPARAATTGFVVPPGVTVTDGGENCNGVVPTPGSANTDKV